MRKRSDFVFESVDLLSYHVHKISLKEGKSYTKAPEWVINTRATTLDKMRQNVKINKSSIQIPNSPPYPLISMLNLAKFCCQKPKTLSTTLIWGERGFFTGKEIFDFV